MVRGFDLSADEALDVLADWNARCQPPWPEQDLMNKVRGRPILPKFSVPDYLKEHPYLVPDEDPPEADAE